VIRAQIEIDPQTAALTISSDPLPQIVLGVPLRIQGVTLDIDRPDFVFDPTNCDAQQVSATIAGAQGASVYASNPFAVGDCKSLAFKPSLRVSTSAHASYADGASLDTRLTFPKTGQGAQANLARIKLVLPKQLSSRLTTLQDACPRTTFDANPSACPKASIVGIARALTPILSGELSGPVYLLAYGRSAFPSPMLVLQGDGVRLDLAGSTVVESSGKSSVAFNAIPDIPIDRFELYLPQGAHSLLGTTTSLCALHKIVVVKHEITLRVHGLSVRRTVEVRKRVTASLTMPSELVAQNGAVIDQNTRIEVNGCTTGKAKAARLVPTVRPVPTLRDG
jgi:hypothetical protein